MQNTKIISFLRSLSRKEFREFGKFANSPFHNNRTDVIRFYNLLKPYFPDFDSEEISNEHLFRKLYPAKKYEPNTIVLLCSYMYDLGREYLAISNLRENKFFYKYTYLKELDKHFADDLFEKEYRSAEEQLNDEELSNDHFRHRSMLELLKINHNLARNRQENTCSSTISYGDNSIWFFLVDLAETYHGMLANKNSFNYDFSNSAAFHFTRNFNFENFFKSLDPEKIPNFDYIAYYYYLFMSNYFPENIDHFHMLKEYSFKNFGKLSENERFSRFNYLIDYCIYRMESGRFEFLHESFNLYADALNRRIFHTSGNLSVGMMFFRNFVTIGLAAKEYEYIERFISEYGKEISGEMKDDVLELSYAMLNYEKKEYDKSLECLSRISNAVPLFKLSTKFLQVKIYYDMNQIDSLLSLIDTYRHYLKGDKIIPRHTRELHSAFLNYVARLAKLKSSGETESVFVLKRELSDNRMIDFRHKIWLLEKANELEMS